MTSSYPSEIVKAWQTAVLKASPGCKDLAQVLLQRREDLLLIWRSYTQERDQLGRLPLTEARLSAPYLMGFHLSNWAKSVSMLERSFEKGLTLPNGQGSVRIIDLGCGTGAAALGAAWAISQKENKAEIALELVDRSRHLIQSARDMCEILFPQTSVKSLSKALSDPTVNRLIDQWQKSNDRLQVVMLSYVWNELAKNPRHRDALMAKLIRWNYSKVPTWLGIIEPANEESAKQSMDLRDILVEGGWSAIYPCPPAKFCPMSSRDWCYSEFEWTKPESQEAIDRSLKVSRERMGGAAYLFINPAAAKPLTLANRAVVVGHPPGATLKCTGTAIERVKAVPEKPRGSYF